MRKFSSSAARALPQFPNFAWKVNNSSGPKPSGPSKVNSSDISIQYHRTSSTYNHESKDSKFRSPSIPQANISAHKFNSKPVDHLYLAEILSRKDWFLLLNHELKAQGFCLTVHTIVSILQNQNNPLCSLRFYIWVMNASPPLTKNKSISTALSYVLYRKGPIFLSGDLIQDIKTSGCRVSEDMLCLLIGSWGRLGLARYSTDVFHQISYLEINPSTRLYNAVIDGLVKSNSLDLAYLKFQQMEVDNCIPDRFTYNILIHGVCKAGVVDEALRLVKQMENVGYSPNVFTYSILIDGFCYCRRVNEAFDLLERMKTRNIKPNDVTYKSLVNGVFRCLSPEEAFNLLSRWVSEESNLHRVVYDAILYCLCSNSLPKQAASFLKKAEELGYVPDSSISSIIITSLTKGLDLDETCQIFDNLINLRVKVDFNVCLVLVDALYNSKREIKGDLYVSWMFQQGFITNVFAYNMVIHCFSKAKMMNRALKTLEDMSKTGILPNLVTFNTLISGYCKVGDIKNARKMLVLLFNHGVEPDFFTYSSILGLLCQVNYIDDALGCFVEMEARGIAPNAPTYNILIRSLCISGDVVKAKELLRKMQNDGLHPDVHSFNALIKMYCKAKKIDKAERLLLSMVTLDLHLDNDSYISLINALWQSGKLAEVKELFSSMEVNGCILDAYTCNCVIETLEKLGKFEEAESVRIKYESKGMTVRKPPVNVGSDL